jgi:hypothetical protein
MHRDRVEALTGISLRVCPACHQGEMVIIERLLPTARPDSYIPIPHDHQHRTSSRYSRNRAERVPAVVCVWADHIAGEQPDPHDQVASHWF